MKPANREEFQHARTPLLPYSYVITRSLENTELGLKQLQTLQKVLSKTQLLSWPDALPQGLNCVIKILYCSKVLAQLQGSFQKLCKSQSADPCHAPPEPAHSGREVRRKGAEWPDQSVSG